MSKNWCEENKAERPVDRRKGVENTASFKANGTGPYRLKERQPSTRTVLVRNFALLGQGRGQRRRGGLHADRHRCHARGGTAVGRDRRDGAGAAAGRRARQGRGRKLKVLQGPELRTIFLGMDQKRDELLFSSVKGKNPFKDKRVRQAFFQAIDIEAIKSRVMRSAATPTALMIGPGVHGLPARHEQAPAVRPGRREEAARRGRLPERLRGRHELPERPLRQRRRDLPGGGGQPGAHRRQGQPAGRDQGHLLPEDPAPQHQLLPARLDARAPTTRTTRCTT